MAHGSLMAVEALEPQNSAALIGITDLISVQTANGVVLFTSGRGGGWVTSFNTGMVAGEAEVSSEYQIPDGWLQLEATDLVFRGGANGGEVLLAGLGNTDMVALQVSGAEASFEGTHTHTAPGIDFSTISQITELNDQGHTLGGLRIGGLIQGQFSSTGQASVTQVTMPVSLTSAKVSALDSMLFAGTTYAVAAFGAENTFVLLSDAQGGALTVQSSVTADARLSFNQLSDAVLTQVDGIMYTIVAASGTGSLSVFEVDPTTGDMTAVDFVLDTRDTRFADAAFLKAIIYEGETYLVAAGSDQGLTLMTLMPGGKLRVLDSLAGSLELPLNNITDIELATTGDTLRIWVSTMAAPYLSEFSVDLSGQGTRLVAGTDGEALSGTGGSDILWGGEGADELLGGTGDDVLRDGAGMDTMSGGEGVDTFVFTVDGATDTITDFQRGVDQIDLGQTSLADVEVIEHVWGSELRYGDDVIMIYSSDGDLLRADEILATFVTDLSSVSLVPQDIYPDTDPDDNPTSPTDPEVDPVAPVAVVATENDDLLLGGVINDTLDGMGGHDRVSGREGDDIIFGRGGNDTLVGGDGADSLQGGDGDDVIYGDSTTFMDWI